MFRILGQYWFVVTNTLRMQVNLFRNRESIPADRIRDRGLAKVVEEVAADTAIAAQREVTDMQQKSAAEHTANEVKGLADQMAAKVQQAQAQGGREAAWGEAVKQGMETAAILYHDPNIPKRPVRLQMGDYELRITFKRRNR